MTDPNRTIARGQTTQTPLGRETPSASRETIIERSRLRRVAGYRAPLAALLIFLGLVPFVAELVRYYFLNIAIRGAPIALGAVLAFVGFYLLDSKGSLGGGAFLVNSTVAIIGVIRGGRRATDPKVVTADPSDTPTSNPAVGANVDAPNPRHPSREG